MKLFIGGLPFGMEVEEVNSLISEYGKIISLEMPKDHYTNETRGFGFFEYEQNSDADKAIKALNGLVFKGRSLKVNVAANKNTRNKSRRRY
jgi:RNA recognition motif-containing protein